MLWTLVLATLLIGLLPLLDATRLQLGADPFADPVGHLSRGQEFLVGLSLVFGHDGLGIVMGLIVGLLMAYGRRGEAAATAVAFLGAIVADRLAKLWIAAPRPYLRGDAQLAVPAVPRLLLVAIVAGLLLCAVVPRWRRVALLAAVSVAVMSGAALVLAHFVPVVAGRDGFPSGHATGSMTLAAVSVILSWRTRFRTIVIAGAALMLVGVGVSRVYIDAHYPADIVGGWCVGLAVVGLAWLLPTVGAGSVRHPPQVPSPQH